MRSWNRFRTRQLELPIPHHDQNLLPVIRAAGGSQLFTSGFGSFGRAARKLSAERVGLRMDQQIVNEFRAKLRVAEDLIAKLAFSLREIQDMRRKPKPKDSKRKRSRAAQVVGSIGLAPRGSGGDL